MAARGFTLLEMLVVLAVTSLVAGYVVPSLGKLYARTEYALARDGVYARIAGLGYRAYVLGQSFDLDAGKVTQPLTDDEPMLELPAGWRIETPKPIHFAFTGECTGGYLSVIDPDGMKTPVRLSAPLCDPNHD
jgi:prepilin-type N-terminal cleavage/methylation domain-containing protein